MIDPAGRALLEALDKRLAKIQKIDDLARIEKQLEDRMASYFRRQGEAFLSRLERRRAQFPAPPPPKESINGDDWNRDLSGAFEESRPGFRVAVTSAHEAAMLKGGERAVANLGADSSFNLKNPRAVAWLEEHAAEKVAADVEDTTRRYIATVVTKGVEEGWSYDRTAAAITARFAEFAEGSPLAHIESRAHLIAVTENAYAYEKGNAIVAATLAEAGLPMQKAWLTVDDDKVDEADCLPNEGEGWIPLDQTFQDGSDEPPAHPGCRCTIAYQQVPLPGTPQLPTPTKSIAPVG